MAQAGSLLWLVGGASLLGVVMRFPIAPATWLALVALLHATRSLRPLPGIPYLWVAIYIAQFIARRVSVPVSGVAYAGVMAVESTVAMLPFVLDRLLAPRVGAVASTMIFPMALVTVEFVWSRVTPGATWGSLAYTQYGSLPLMQLAAFVGIWGITFMMAWFAATVELVWRHGFVWSVVATPVLTYVAVFLAVMVGGAARIALAPAAGATLRAATLNRPVDLFAPGEMTRIAEGRVSDDERPRLAAKLRQLHEWFLDGSRREARAGARLIVWPEMNLLVFKEDEAAFVVRARHLARDERVYLAMGMGTVYVGDRFPFENKLLLVDPSGSVAVSYVKTHPVAGWEAGIMKRGDGRLPVLQTDTARIASAICFDASFPEFMRQAGQASADVLVLPVNEWKGIEQIHFQIDAFRAIENGMSIVRAAASGLSGAIDPWGRVLGVADYFAAGDRTMTAQVPTGGVPTVYARTGDVFAWLCVAGLVIALGSATVGSAIPSVNAMNPGRLITRWMASARR